MIFKKYILKKEYIAVFLVFLIAVLVFVSYSYAKEKQQTDFYRVRVMLMMLDTIQDPKNGIQTWNSEEEWTWHTSKIGKYGLNYSYDGLGDYGKICSMLSDLSRTKWDDPNRSRIAEEMTNLKVVYVVQPWEKEILIQE